MDPMYSYDMSASNEGTKKNNRDFQNINRSNIVNTVGADTRIPVFGDAQINSQDRQSRKIKQDKAIELQKGGELPRRGTFDPPTFQELVTKSNELFESRHHILSKLSSNGIYDEMDEKDEDLIELMKDTLNQPDIIYKETAKSVVQSCKDSYKIQNLIKEKIFETSQYSSFKNKVDDFYKRSEVFMHAVSSDDEAPSNLDPVVRFDPKEIRKRIKNLPNRNSQAKSRKEMKKRAKKIIKKLKTEAFDCEDYNRSSKNLVELQRLVLRNKVKRAAPTKKKTNIEFNQKTILELKKELENLITSSKDMKSLQYYEDQISFYRLEKRFKEREKEPDRNEPSVINSSYKLVKKNAARIQNIIMDSCGIHPEKIGYERPRKEAYKKGNTIIKVIGVTKEDILSLPQYRIQPDKMPTFSGMFERSEVPAAASTSLGNNNMMVSNVSTFSHTKTEGLPVISLSFNPYECDTELKKQTYKKVMADLSAKKEKFKKLEPEMREKMETMAIQKEWAIISKKEVPKMAKAFQKNSSEIEQNNKKILANIQKDVKKRTNKILKPARECLQRARRLQREMLTYWRKKDKEIQERKKKRDKAEKEIKKKQDEERESLNQKKRLELIMRKSEIYTHFMATKLGLAEQDKREAKGEVEIDEAEAEAAVIDIIKKKENEKKKFNLPVEKDRSDEIRLDTVDTSMSTVFSQPNSFKGTLKEYQIKGLRWLDSLYQQGINGILADEMGLGKTIQAISLLSHLSENRNDWGPFCIVAPSTTLHNWKNEIERFCPNLRVLPYWGNSAERKMLRKFFNPKHLNMPYSPFHVVITSYQLIAMDEKYFKRPKWRYMILDEAQAIKNYQSQRWGVLLSFDSRNRLLLTGTPIQNSMAELWALLHFIMPDLFDSHDQFQEWFSKDIESQALKDEGEINKRHLERLHKVLKPFMLRRVKKDVENELGPKTEYNEICEMTYRQRTFYKELKNMVKGKNIIQTLNAKNKLENLMNLVMQLRKVCNHPELLKPKETNSPLLMIPASDYDRKCLSTKISGMSTTIPNKYKEVFVRNYNPISYHLPKTVYDECYGLWTHQCKLATKEIWYGLSNTTKQRFFNIYAANRVYENTYNPSCEGKFNDVQMRSFTKNCFSAHLLYGLTFGNIEYLSYADPFLQVVCLLHFLSKGYRKNYFNHVFNNSEEIVELKYGSMMDEGISLSIVNPSQTILYSFTEYKLFEQNSKKIEEEKIITEDVVMENTEESKQISMKQKLNLEELPPLVYEDISTMKRGLVDNNAKLEIYQSEVISCPVDLYCLSSSFMAKFTRESHNFHAKRIIFGGERISPSKSTTPGRLLRDKSTLLPCDGKLDHLNNFPCAIEGGTTDLMLFNSKGYSGIEIPDFKRLINDCGKMKILDKLLKKLYNEKHRCLIFCQMTKMMDIIEEYLSWMQYQYFRMDGSTQINDRRDMVEEYQKNENIFCFLLSTRAGGLGVTLTGADTVIFYDNDWNPTMDAQATDRAHRIGQTKPVSVYRLITRHTVEENILKRAKQKENVQSTVYAGGALRADVLKPSEIVGLLVDEENEDDKKPRSFIKPKRKPKKEKEEVKKKIGDLDSIEPAQGAHKIHYHHLEKGDRNLKTTDEDEEKAKEALKYLKQHKNEDDNEEDDVNIDNELKDILDNEDDAEINLEDDEVDKIQIDES